MEKKIYVRDKRSPIPANENVSKIMSANKAKNTSAEIRLRKALYGNGLRGYRLNYKKIPGRPDIAFVSKKIAVFVNGCFWHQCPHCKLPLPKSNTNFWKEKFERNILRDRMKSEELKKLGWEVVILWECELNKNLSKSVSKIQECLRHEENYKSN
jgi:DNA mismatch endonuclease (patch repair protein)